MRCRVVSPLEWDDDVYNTSNAAAGSAVFGSRLPAGDGRVAANFYHGECTRVAKYSEVENDCDDGWQERDEEQDGGKNESQ